jgi:protein-tyrosine phosphatase
LEVVDLHCHILPGVDDGADTLDDSVVYARTAVAAGTRIVVATPHVEQVVVGELPERVAELRAALAHEGVALDVRVGGELKPESVGELSDAQLDLIAHGPPGARWLLFEVPFHGVDDTFLEGARELGRRGFGLLLAHPERSRGILAAGRDAIERLVAEGALVAANVDPLQGGEGSERERAAVALLRRGLPAVLATDAHPPRRPFTLAMGRAAVEAATGRPDLARRLTADAPARLLTEGLGGARRAA